MIYEEIDSEGKLKAVIKGIDDKKGTNIKILELSDLDHAVSDYFIICEGTSTTQVNAIAGAVEDELKKQFSDKPFRTEGLKNCEWVILDYIDIVVHIFLPEAREFYKLDLLWADANSIDAKPYIDIPLINN